MLTATTIPLREVQLNFLHWRGFDPVTAQSTTPMETTAPHSLPPLKRWAPISVVRAHRFPGIDLRSALPERPRSHQLSPQPATQEEPITRGTHVRLTRTSHAPRRQELRCDSVGDLCEFSRAHPLACLPGSKDSLPGSTSPTLVPRGTRMFLLGDGALQHTTRRRHGGFLASAASVHPALAARCDTLRREAVDRRLSTLAELLISSASPAAERVFSPVGDNLKRKAVGRRLSTIPKSPRCELASRSSSRLAELERSTSCPDASPRSKKAADLTHARGRKLMSLSSWAATLEVL